MPTENEVIDFLVGLKNQFDNESDEYADISQTIHYIEQEGTYNVYEVDGTEESFIGAVRAQNMDRAVEQAHEKYGAPITVKEND